MKTKRSLSVISVVLIFSACSKQEPAPAASTQSPPSHAPAAAAVTAEAEKVAVEVQAKAEPAVTQVVKTPEAAVPSVPTPPVASAPVPTQIQTVFDQVKGLISEKKYPEALAALSQLSNVNLTAEQQSMLQQLKTQIQNAMASQTANDGLKAVGGLLNPKK